MTRGLHKPTPPNHPLCSYTHMQKKRRMHGTVLRSKKIHLQEHSGDVCTNELMQRRPEVLSIEYMYTLIHVSDIISFLQSCCNGQIDYNKQTTDV